MKTQSYLNLTISFFTIRNRPKFDDVIICELRAYNQSNAQFQGIAELINCAFLITINFYQRFVVSLQTLPGAISGTAIMLLVDGYL